MNIKLFIGLGNPDPEYQNTRHNIGFMLIDHIAKKGGFDDFELNKKINAQITKGKIDKTVVVLAKPLSYVNKTGEVAIKLKKFYKVKPEDIIVIQDDLDIPFGNAKLSMGKNSGGHRGIDSVIKALKTKDFYRLRIGTAKKALDKARDQSDKKRDEFVRNFVLSKFSPTEQDELKAIFKDAYARLEQGNIIK